jgi:hypothetical protein
MSMKAYPPLTAYRITYSDGNVTDTNMAAGVTLADAQEYYVGKWFDVGAWDEKLAQAVKVEKLA